jgi:hypothetical protein
MDSKTQLQQHFERHEVDLAACAWVSKADRWAELVFYLLNQCNDQEPETTRMAVTMLQDLKLLEIGKLAIIEKPTDENAVVLTYVLKLYGFSEEDAQRAVSLLAQMAKVIQRDTSGKIQRYLRRRVEAMRGDPVSTITKVVPYFQGTAAIATIASGIFSIFQGVKSEQEKEKFHKQMLGYLQGFQQDFEKLSKQLDQIMEQLRNIEKDIKGLELNPALNAIQTWGEDLAALDPHDKVGLKKLAADMMDTKDPNISLEGYMNLIHNNIVGNIAGRPALEVFGIEIFLLLRARLFQGLHLLTFACAYDEVQKFDCDIFVAGWCKKFDQEIRVAVKYDHLISSDFIVQAPGRFSGVKDSVFVLQVLQPSIPDVTLLVTRDDIVLPLHSGTLGFSMPQGFSRNVLGFQGIEVVGIDWKEKKVLTPEDPEFRNCDPIWGEQNRWEMVTLYAFSALSVNPGCFWFQSSHRQPENDAIFLGSFPGQISTVSDSNDLVTSIHAGPNSDAPLLILRGDYTDPDDREITTVDFETLNRISSALWRITYVDQQRIRIAFFLWNVDHDREEYTPASNTESSLTSESDPILYATIDTTGEWTITTDEKQAVLEVALIETDPQPMTLSYTQKPTAIQVARRLDTGPAKTLVLRRL